MKTLSWVETEVKFKITLMRPCSRSWLCGFILNGLVQDLLFLLLRMILVSWGSVGSLFTVHSAFSGSVWYVLMWQVQGVTPATLIAVNEVSEVAQMSLTLCDPMDCSLPGSSVHGIFQARILEWVAISFSRGSSQPRDWTQVSHIVGRRFTLWATREVQTAVGTVRTTVYRPFQCGAKELCFQSLTHTWSPGTNSWICSPRGNGTLSCTSLVTWFITLPSCYICCEISSPLTWGKFVDTCFIIGGSLPYTILYGE